MLSEDDLLVRELGKLGGFGARFTARFLSLNVGEITKTLPFPLQKVEGVCHLLIPEMYRVDEPQNGGVIRAIVGAGIRDLNPTVLTVSFDAVSLAATRVHIRGAAKEGMLKQRSGEQAANRFWAALEQALPLEAAT